MTVFYPLDRSGRAVLPHDSRRYRTHVDHESPHNVGVPLGPRLRQLDKRVLGSDPQYDEPVPAWVRRSGSFAWWALSFLVGATFVLHGSGPWLLAGWIAYVAIAVPEGLAGVR